MKKTYSILFLLFITSIASYGQWFSIGAKIGYNTTLSSRQDYNDIFSIRNNMQNGLHTGIYMRLGRRIYAQPEVLYNFSTYQSTFNQNKSETIKTHLIDVPVLLGVSAINKDKFKFRIMAGPKFSFDVGSSKPKEFSKITETIRKSRLGLDCGIGFDIWRITLDIRYNLFPNLYKIKDSENKTISNIPQHTFQISAGFRIFGQNSNK